MVIRTHTTGTITCTTTTDSATLPDVTGKIIAVAIKPSGVATNFRLSTTKGGIIEYILGSAAVVNVAAAGKIFYPKIIAQDIDSADLATDRNIMEQIIMDHADITIAVTACAALETYVVDIIVEE